MRLLGKKISVFGKSLPAIVIALVICAGLGSAALLSYYGTITGQATVSQSVKLDGFAWDSTANIYDASPVAGSTVVDGPHVLTNDAEVPATVKFETSCVDSEEESCSEGITTTYVTAEFQEEGTGTAEWSNEQASSGSYSAKLTVPAGGVLNAARVIMPSPVATVNDISSASVEYYLTTDSTTTSSPYIILELDTNGDGVKDDWAVSWQDDGVSTGTWLTHTATSWHVVSTGMTVYDLAGLKTLVGSARILKVKVAVGEWTFTGKTSAYVDDITINDVAYDLEKIPDGFPTSFTIPAGEGFDFFIVNSFNVALIPDTYTITTSVKVQ